MLKYPPHAKMLAFYQVGKPTPQHVPFTAPACVTMPHERKFKHGVKIRLEERHRYAERMMRELTTAEFNYLTNQTGTTTSTPNFVITTVNAVGTYTGTYTNRINW